MPSAVQLSKGARSTKPQRVAIGFSTLLVLAVAVGYIPVVQWPFNWIATFSHEMTQALVAMFSGGRVESFVLHPFGYGRAVTDGGDPTWIHISGYFGSLLVGMAIYCMADRLGEQATKVMVVLAMFWVVVPALFWVRDAMSWAVLAGLFAQGASVYYFQHRYVVRLLLRITGLYVLMDACRAPLHILDQRYLRDGLVLEEITGMPEYVWLALWVISGMIGLMALWSVQSKLSEDK
jgi:hypothetical protein